MSLKVNEIFSSIQTEGPFAGTPATFIRLSGCNLFCSFCDTDHSYFEELEVDAIVDVIQHKGHRLVVITGGEPFLQDFSELAQELIDRNFVVQVETNGTLCPEWVQKFGSSLIVVCSPKQDIHPDLWGRLIAAKLLCTEHTRPEQVVVLKATCDSKDIILYLQPQMGGDNEQENIHRTVELCKSTGSNFSLQYHKLIDIP